MMAPIIVPDLQAGQAVLSLWLAQPGEEIFAGDRLVEVLVAGATFDVAAPATGRLLEQRAYVNDPLHPGQILGLVEVNLDAQP